MSLGQVCPDVHAYTDLLFMHIHVVGNDGNVHVGFFWLISRFNVQGYVYLQTFLRNVCGKVSAPRGYKKQQNPCTSVPQCMCILCIDEFFPANCIALCRSYMALDAAPPVNMMTMDAAFNLVFTYTCTCNTHEYCI